MNPSGGNLTFSVAPPAGYTLIIINDPDIIQITHYVNADDFPADSHEQALDRLTKICQRLSDRIDRAVRAPDYAPEDQVPDADTLVGLVEDAQEAAANSAASAADSGNSAIAASGSALAAAASAAAASSSASQAAASAAAADVAKIVWRGNWSQLTAYSISDAVFYVGSSFVAKSANSNKDPVSNPSLWSMMAQQGATGAQGEPGAVGPVGPQGPMGLPGPAGTGAGDMLRSANLSDILDKPAGRTNIGLKGAAILDVGQVAGTVAAGDDPRFAAAGIIVSDTPPAGVKDGTLWWESDSGLLFVRYNDGNTTQWVIACPQPDISSFALASDVAAKVAKAGDTMTGNLTINTTSPGLVLNKSGANPAFVAGTVGGQNRWAIMPGNFTAEASGNVGSDFEIYRYDNTGAGIGGPVLHIDRSTGLTTILADPTANLGIATKQYVDSKARDRLTAARTYYFRSDGNDANNGLSNSAGGAFLTSQRAVDTIVNTVDVAGFTVTIQRGNAAPYSGGCIFTPWVGGGTIVYDGAGQVFTATSAEVAIMHGVCPGEVYVQNMTVQTVTSGSGIKNEGCGIVRIGAGIVFGACATDHIRLEGPNAVIYAQNNYSITGGAQYHVRSGHGAFYQNGNASLVFTVTGNPTFSGAFAYAQDRSGINYWGGAAFSGTAVGPKYLISGAAVIVANNDPNFFPGTVAGSSGSGGIYS